MVDSNGVQKFCDILASCGAQVVVPADRRHEFWRKYFEYLDSLGPNMPKTRNLLLYSLEVKA